MLAGVVAIGANEGCGIGFPLKVSPARSGPRTLLYAWVGSAEQIPVEGLHSCAILDATLRRIPLPGPGTLSAT